MKRRRLKKGKSPFGGKEGLIREPTIDPRRAGFLPFARVVPATSICRDSSGVYRQLPDPANFCLLGWQLALRVDYHVTVREGRENRSCYRQQSLPFASPPKIFKTLPNFIKSCAKRACERGRSAKRREEEDRGEQGTRVFSIFFIYDVRVTV